MGRKTLRSRLADIQNNGGPRFRVTDSNDLNHLKTMVLEVKIERSNFKFIFVFRDLEEAQKMW